MKKVMRIGTVQPYGRRWVSVYVKAEYDEEKGRFSISGVMGPTESGNCIGSCGQIDMGFAHRNPADDDRRYSAPIPPDKIRFAPGWDAEKWLDLLDIWKRWHLNDLRAGCEHQREMGWTYDEHHDPKTFKGEACPVCGYEIGSAWLKEEVPEDVIKTVASWPDADRQPAWI
jgi:hypothetical protein